MMPISYLYESLTSRGFKETIKRILTLIKRYGLSKKRMFNNLELLIDILHEYDAKATLPITATTLLHNPEILEVLDKRIELAMHGYKHIDHTQLSYNELLRQLNNGLKIFKKYKVKVYGFRAPYLKVNDTVTKVISCIGLKYDSSYPIFFDVLPNDLRNAKCLKKLITLYNNVYNDGIKYNAPTVFKLRNGIIEIPVTLPDDEILVDRLSLNPTDVAKYWVRILDVISKFERGVFVLQIHPERICFLECSLRKVLEEAISKGFDLVNLKDVCIKYEKGKMNENKYYLAITGDIDIMGILDILRVR